MTIAEVLAWVDETAPLQTAEDFDNPGLLLGDESTRVTDVLFGMDVTEDMALEAARLHAQLIITHHPFIFHPIRHIDYTGPQGRALRVLMERGISVIAAHTNWDKAEGGVSDSLANVLGLQNVVRADDYLRVGELPQPMPLNAFADLLADKLRIKPRRYGERDACIARVAVAGGAYGEGYALAAKSGAHAFVMGEIRHHEILDACARGLVVYDAGHYPTEWPGVRALYQRFLKDCERKGLPIRSHLYDTAPFAGALLA